MSYSNLAIQLSKQPEAEVPFTFDEIERVIGRRLPDSARRHQAWWANTRSHSHAHAWLDAGWKTSRLDLIGERIVFVRGADRPRTDLPQRSIGALEPSRDGSSDEPDQIVIRLGSLPGATRRLLEEFAEALDGDRAAAAMALMREAVLSRRRELVKRLEGRSVAGGVDSVDLIREDRDAR